MQNNDLVGKVVLSKAGRDKNHLYVIVKQLDEQYVFLANGSTKTILKPKKKKLKHIEIVNVINDEIKSCIANDDISTDLKIKRFLKFEGIVKEGWLPYVKRWCYRNARYCVRITT